MKGKLSAEQVPENSIWRCLERYYAKMGNADGLERLVESVFKKYSYKEKSEVRKTFKTEMPSIDDKGPYRHYFMWIQILHLVYRIPFEEFGFSQDDIYDKSYSGESRAEWLRDKGGIRLTGKAFEDKYLEICGGALKKVKNKLWVYDYLGKSDTKEPEFLDAYYEANGKLYEIIEDKLSKNSRFEYIRFLALPLQLSSNFDLENYANNSSRRNNDAASQFVQSCSLQLLRHICNCLKKFPSIRNPFTDDGFYIVPQASRAHHFAILDTDTTFGEYYRINNEGITRPDILFLESNNETSELLVNVYGWEKKTLMKTPNKKAKLDIGSVKEAARQAIISAKKKYKAAWEKRLSNPREQVFRDNFAYVEYEYRTVAAKYRFIKSL